MRFLNKEEAEGVGPKGVFDTIRFYIKNRAERVGQSRYGFEDSGEILLHNGKPVHKAFPRLLHQPTNIPLAWARSSVYVAEEKKHRSFPGICIECPNNFEIQIDTDFDVRQGYRGNKVPQCLVTVPGLDDMVLLVDIRPEALMETIASCTISGGKPLARFGVYYEGSSYRIVPLGGASWLAWKKTFEKKPKMTSVYPEGAVFSTKTWKRVQYLGKKSVRSSSALGVKMESRPCHLYILETHYGWMELETYETKMKIDVDTPIETNQPIPNKAVRFRDWNISGILTERDTYINLNWEI